MAARDINPFSVIFGVEPQSIIPRRNNDEMIISTFENERPRTYSYAIVGIRGCGKTVLLTHIQKHFLKKDDWIVLRLNPEMDFFESAISQLGEHVTLAKEMIDSVNLQMMGMGAGLSKRSLSNNETILRKMLKAVEKKKKRVLIVIDEVTNSENFKIFAHSYQSFIGEGLRVFLLVTLLPENLESLGNSKNSTFLRRIPRISLSDLNDYLVSNEYAKIFNISRDQADELAKTVRGYSFAYQVLGDLLWESGMKTVNADILDEFDMIMDECVYTPIWNNLPEREKAVLGAIAESEDNSIKSIRAILEMQSNEFSPYRDRLATRGLINIKTYGRAYFRLPRFKEFVIRKRKFEEW